jgi:5-methylcytosine-specific restriction endonuclease McrA
MSEYTPAAAILTGEQMGVDAQRQGGGGRGGKTMSLTPNCSPRMTVDDLVFYTGIRVAKKYVPEIVDAAMTLANGLGLSLEDVLTRMSCCRMEALTVNARTAIHQLTGLGQRVTESVEKSTRQAIDEATTDARQAVAQTNLLLERVEKLLALDRDLLKESALGATRVTKWLRGKVIARDGLKCRYCGKTVRRERVQIDHVIPVALGGPGTVDNLVVSCPQCNQKKGSKTPEQAGMVLLPLDNGEGE